MLGTDQFKRIPIGVGRPTNGMSVPDYVLQRFSKRRNGYDGKGD